MVPTPPSSDPPSPAWRPLAWLALWLLLTAAWRPLAIPDEGRYAGVAYEMLRGSWLVPTLDGLPFFHKPPLLYWLDIAAMAVLGVREFSVRVGPALGAFVLGASLFLHLRRSEGPAPARMALLVLATTPFFFIGGQFVNHDIGVAGCISAAVLAAVRGLGLDRPDSVRSTRWLVVAWGFCGLGMLAKGLIGLVLPGLVIVPWLLVRRRWRELRALLNPWGMAVCAVLVLPWIVAMQARYPGFVDYFIVEQHFRRYAAAAFNNPQPAWFYLWTLPLCTMPWSLWLWPAWREARLRRHTQPLVGLYLWWVVVVVGFFSLPHSKLIGYVLPVLAPGCALLTPALCRQPRLWPRVAAVAAAACLGIVAAVAWQAPKSMREPALALAALRQPADRVVFIDGYFYDIPFYARLDAPVHVVADWDDPGIPRRDDWRKELHDAARFAGPAQRSVLWPRARLAELLCHTGTVWILGAPDKLAALGPLAGLRPAWVGRSLTILEAPGRACAPGAPP